MRILATTWSISIVGTKPKGPAIVVFWHGEMLPIWYSFRKDHPMAIVSSSKDGSLLSRWLQDIGFALIRGSSSQGGREVLAKMIDAVKTGPVLITPDGPRGPAMQAKLGALIASQRTGIPITMARMRATPSKVFTKSWDAFVLPLPFAKVSITMSDPFLVPSESTQEDVDMLVKKLEEEMAKL